MKVPARIAATGVVPMIPEHGLAGVLATHDVGAALVYWPTPRRVLRAPGLDLRGSVVRSYSAVPQTLRAVSATCRGINEPYLFSVIVSAMYSGIVSATVRSPNSLGHSRSV